MKISKKIDIYEPNKNERKVLNILGNMVNDKCWESFTELYKQLNEKKRLYEIQNNIMEQKKIQCIINQLNHSEIRRMKCNIKEHYKNQLMSVGIDYICYYCETNLILNQRGDDISQLDHIMPKKDYPEYTLRPINLIPSCPLCNTKYKLKYDPIQKKQGEIENCEFKIIHPYLDNKEDYFSSDTKYIFKIRDDISNDSKKKAMETVKLFKLNEFIHVENKIKLEKLIQAKGWKRELMVYLLSGVNE